MSHQGNLKLAFKEEFFLYKWLLPVCKTGSTVCTGKFCKLIYMHTCVTGVPNSYDGLARQMTSWAYSKKIQYWGAMAVFLLHAFGPGLAFLMGMYCYAKLSTPWGIILALILLIGGFLYPMLAFHRIVHPAKWPCPSMHGAFLFGITITMAFYYVQVLPNILNIIHYMLYVYSMYCIITCVHMKCIAC